MLILCGQPVLLATIVTSEQNQAILGGEIVQTRYRVVLAGFDFGNGFYRRRSRAKVECRDLVLDPGPPSLSTDVARSVYSCRWLDLGMLLTPPPPPTTRTPGLLLAKVAAKMG